VGAGLAGPAAGGVVESVPGAFNGAYSYNDSWRGWPVSPVDSQHPIRGSLNDPRPSGFHIGLDISVRDDQPEEGAPAGRTHLVYAVEGGTVSLAANVAAVGCVNRIVRVGHFAYWHVDPVGVVADGAVVEPGQQIGWTCEHLWHVHLSEWALLNGVRTWVDPLHAGGKLAPFVDTARPRIQSIRFFEPSATRWEPTDAVLEAPPAGAELPRSALRGLVDVRAAIADVQSFRGWYTEAHPYLYADLHPYRVRVTVRRHGGAGRVVLRREVFRADRILGEGEEVMVVEPSVRLAEHYAPETRQNLGAGRCVETAPASCAGRYVLRLFARRGGRRFWNTRSLRNGRYRLSVTAWDQTGNRSTSAVRIQIRN
jgi:hypothetical protein